MAAQGKINQWNVPEIVPATLFRAYDIRGPVTSEALTPGLAYAVGLSIGSEAREQGQKAIVVGRDGRLSGPKLTAALIQGLCETGLAVLNFGLVPTPLVYFATNRLETNSGVMVTASHNPGHHNGFKIVLNGKTLRSEEIATIRTRILERRFVKGHGAVVDVDIIEDYESYITKHIQLDRPLKVVVDCGNGIAGKVAPALYRKLGCEVVELFCEVDGHFPNHHPDPTIPANLTDLIHKVKETQADLGLAFDGDADRLGIVTDKGEIIWPDRQMMLFSMDVLSRLPGSDIVFDVKCSRSLAEIIKKYGGNPVMWRTGHSILKAKLFEIGAPLAGEMSGHIFFKDEWFGFDDGIYVGARLLRIISQTNQRTSEIFAELPDSVNTPELKLPMTEEKKQPFMQALLKKADFGNAKLITIDGLRVEFEDGWGLIRPSNTSPYLILRFEADTEEKLKRIQEIFRTQLRMIDNALELPF
ncbi:phosphomannomutase/phosphoglucomutase [Coxiella burnetii]|uniref:phosphomannomutase/phosphoglucomutase n=1 Tax=Coxiella burnetii TaxID=777 RepID=UPI000163A462|nr:phosphomannomutase/phosphoglucomutase [Coxiella burnetii]ATN85608.1 phosphoglucomutase [Coxiella burnetii str. Schperling]EDR35469.1 phosphomannomutase [Coxiella burnetii Q321]